VDVVTVTVDRRERRLQDYPGSADVVTQHELERANINSLKDFGALTPATQIGTVEGNTEVFVRGVGHYDNTELGDPGVGTHLDGIYVPRPRAVGGALFDLERIEVSRGPQGTVRGRNSTGGTLNIISNKPKYGEFGADATLQSGNYSQRVMKGMLNIPIGDALAFRIAGFSEAHSPYYDNAGPVANIIPNETGDILAYRAGVKWNPIKAITVLVGHDLTVDRGTGFGGSNYGPALRAGLLPDEVPNPRALLYHAGPPPQTKTVHWGVYGDVTADLGPAKIQYIGGFRDLVYKNVSGANSGIAFPGAAALPVNQVDNWSVAYWRTASRTQSHELRIFAPDNARLRWTLGGFLFQERQNVFLGTVADQSNSFAGVEFNMPDVKGDSQAGYADATFDITKIWRVTGGMRFTHETKSRTGLGAVWSFTGVNTDGSNFRFGTEGFQYQAENRTLFPTAPLDAAGARAVFLNGIRSFGNRDNLDDRFADPAASLVAANITPQRGSYEDRFLDFRLGTDFDIAKNHLAYGMFSTGHKSGGFNDNLTVFLQDGTSRSIAPEYKPETLYSFEVGSKNVFSNLGLRVNASAFYYIYHDQAFQTISQLSAAAPGQDPNNIPAATIRLNAAKSHSLGVEFDGTLQLPAGFALNASGMLLDAKFDEGSLFDNRLAFGATGTANDRVDISGNRQPHAPLFSVNYGLSQNIRSPVGWFDWFVMAQTRTKQFMTIFNGEGKDAQGVLNPLLSDAVPTHTLLDLGVGYTRPDGRFRLEGFVTNVTDATYMIALLNTPGNNVRFFNPPRLVGLRAQLFY
jgi:iron complex outermembrane recepter protein